MSSVPKFVVKTVFNKDFRRFVLREPSYDLLVRSILQSYENLKPEFTIKYHDDEGDLCLISSDAELVEAFDVTEKKKVLKLTIEGKAHEGAAGGALEPVEPLAEESKADGKAPSEDEEASHCEGKDDDKAALVEIVPLLVSLLKDNTIQKALPQVLSAMLASASRQEKPSVLQVVEDGLASSKEFKEHPATQKLLALLPGAVPSLDAALDHIRHFLPFIQAVATQFLQQLPQLLATIDLDAWGERLLRKLRRRMWWHRMKQMHHHKFGMHHKFGRRKWRHSHESEDADEKHHKHHKFGMHRLLRVLFGRHMCGHILAGAGGAASSDENQSPPSCGRRRCWFARASGAASADEGESSGCGRRCGRRRKCRAGAASADEGESSDCRRRMCHFGRRRKCRAGAASADEGESSDCRRKYHFGAFGRRRGPAGAKGAASGDELSEFCGRRHRRCGPFARAPDGEEKKSEPVHSNIECDGCGQFPLVGVRYKCTVCPDYDLCGQCEAKNLHPAEHTLVKLKEAREPSDVHHGIKCDGCGVAPITGVRFKCTVCHDFDLCQSCEAKQTHDAEHPLVKFKAPRRWGPGRGFRHHGHFARRHGPFPFGPHGFAHGPFPHPHHGMHHGPHHGMHHGPHLHHGPHHGMHHGPHHGMMHRMHRARRHRAEGKDNFQAKFIQDVNYPDGSKINAEETIIKEWEFANPEGAATWPQGVKLIFTRGDRELLGDQEEFPLPAAKPGEKVKVAVALTVPSQLAGKKVKAYFRIADADRNVFGDRCWVELDIKAEQKESAASPAVVPPAPVDSVAAPPSAESDSKQASNDQSEKYKAAMELLSGMGFDNPDLNLRLLEKANGDVHHVITSLLDLRKAA